MEADNKKKIIKALYERRVSQWLTAALVDWFCIIAAMSAVGWANHWAVYILAVFVIGNRQHALAFLGHDGSHYAISKNRKLNDLLTGLLTFWPLGVPLKGYRCFHCAHHQFNGTDKDPELIHKRARAPQWDLPMTRKKLFKILLSDLCGGAIIDIFWIVKLTHPQNFRDALPIIVLKGTAITSLIFLGLWWVVLLWYVSIFTTFWIFFRLRIWLEHQGTGGTHRVHTNWWQSLLFAPHNASHHWEHHKWPAVPFYNLPKVRELETSPPVVTADELFKSYEGMQVIESGAALASKRR